MRQAIAQALDRENWDDNGELARVWAAGAADPDDNIADRFLASAGAFLRQDPVAAAAVLPKRGISAPAASAAIEGAAGYDGETYGQSLTHDEANAVLTLTAHAGFQSYVVQMTVSAIATRHPRLVLDHLARQAAAGAAPPDDVHGLGEAFDSHPDDLADWVLQQLQQHDETTARHAGLVLQAATNDRLSKRQGDALAARMPTLEATAVRNLVGPLGWLDTWPLRHPALAQAVLDRARATGLEAEISTQLTSSMQPSHWGSINGVSEELDGAFTRAQAAAEVTEDADLRRCYTDAAARIEATIKASLRSHDEDRRTGWE